MILTVCDVAASLIGTASASAYSTGFYIHNLTSVQLTFRSVRDGERGPIQMTLYDGDPASPGTHASPSVECHDGPDWRCVPNHKNGHDPDQVRLLEPPGTNREVGAGNPDRQAELLRTLCTRHRRRRSREVRVRTAGEGDVRTTARRRRALGELLVRRAGSDDQVLREARGDQQHGIKREPDTETIFQRAEAGADDRGQLKW